MAPRQNGLTLTPVRPRCRCSMEGAYVATAAKRLSHNEGCVDRPRSAARRGVLGNTHMPATGYPDGAPACAWFAADDRGERDVIELHRLLEQPVEEQAALLRAAAVEPERELVEVVVELVWAGGALVGAEQPALEERRDAVGARHDDVGGVAAGGDARLFVDEAGGCESAVALPVVGVDDDSGRDCAGDEVRQDRRGTVWDTGEPDPAAGTAWARLDRDRDDRSIEERAAAESARLGGADRGLVDFDLAREPVAARSHHRPAQLGQQRPGALVASQAERPLQPGCAHPVFGARQIPAGREPGRQRQLRVGEDRPRRDRVIHPAARTAQIPSLAHPPRPLAAT